MPAKLVRSAASVPSCPSASFTAASTRMRWTQTTTTSAKTHTTTSGGRPFANYPFGTIKRQWGYTYTLVKGLEKVNGETNLIIFCYNFRRTQTILGFDRMLQALQNWQPDYSKVVRPLKNGLMRLFYPQTQPLFFSQFTKPSFLKAA